jgi:hypothetical protein
MASLQRVLGTIVRNADYSAKWMTAQRRALNVIPGPWGIFRSRSVGLADPTLILTSQNERFSLASQDLGQLFLPFNDNFL